MGKKKNQNILGKSIIKDRFKSSNQHRNGDSWLHTSDLNDGYEWGRLNLNSVTDQNHLDEFLSTAELAGTEFTAERQNIRVVDPNASGLPSVEESRAIQEAQDLNRDLLCIPRRPKWDATTSKEKLAQKERESFLEWRRLLAVLQEKDHIVLTPFERNLEFWRQLWRVIERSDIIVQIVDARNPLLFRCQDLEKYVKEIGSTKVNMVLISKSDLLTPQQRQEWSDYFSQNGVKVAFWSAVLETERIKQEALEEETAGSDGGIGGGLNDDNERASESGQDEEEESDDILTSDSLSVLRDEMPSDGEEAAQQESSVSGIPGAETEQLDRHPTTPQPDPQGDQPSAAPETLSHQAPTEEATAHHQERTDNSCELESQTANLTLNSQTALNEEATPEGCHREESTCQSEGPDSSQDDSNKASGSLSNRHNSESGPDPMSEQEQGDEVGGPVGGNKSCQVENSTKLLTGEELIQLFYDLHTGPKAQDGVTTVGMVGYPNVGKSSTINALLQQKKVPVSATPGRTKHFQTLFVEPTMCLCDCPGLVMPSMVSSQAEMIVSGILCIDHLRDFSPPVTLICQRIPRHILNNIYGINIIRPREGEDLNRVPTAREFLNAYAYMRGFMTHHGIPDCPRAARVILKDYVKGKLLFCHPPPGVDAVEFQAFTKQDFSGRADDSTKPRRELSGPVITDEGTKLKKQPTSSKLDEAFFAQKAVHSHNKGAIGPRGGTSLAQGTQPALSASQQRLIDKPWKKHGNRNKREKLRRVYAHHDE